MEIKEKPMAPAGLLNCGGKSSNPLAPANFSFGGYESPKAIGI